MSTEVRAIGETLAIIMVSLNAALFLNMLLEMRRFNKQQAQRRKDKGGE